MICKILRSKDPLLRKPCKPVTQIDAKILKLVKDLKDTLAVQKDPEGVGLAAPQIGKNLRIFVIGYKDLNRVVINPEVVKENSSDKNLSPKKTSPESPKPRHEILEGCLSLPNYYCSLKRDKKIKIKYLNDKAEEILETFTGFYAQIVAHEMDHLNGVLFLDRLLEQKKPLYKLEKGEWEKVEI